MTILRTNGVSVLLGQTHFTATKCIWRAVKRLSRYIWRLLHSEASWILRYSGANVHRVKDDRTQNFGIVRGHSQPCQHRPTHVESDARPSHRRPSVTITGSVGSVGGTRTSHRQVYRYRPRREYQLLCGTSLSLPILHHNAIARRHEHCVVHRAWIGRLSQHHPRFGPRTAIGLRDNVCTHAPICRQGLRDKVELICRPPDITSRSIDRPGSPIQGLIARQSRSPDITAT